MDAVRKKFDEKFLTVSREEVMTGDSSKLVITSGFYESTEFISIRKWVKAKGLDKWIPLGGRGIFMHKSVVKDHVLSILTKLCNPENDSDKSIQDSANKNSDI